MDGDFCNIYSSLVGAFNVRYSCYLSELHSTLSNIKWQLEKPPDLNVDSAVKNREKRMCAAFHRQFTRINLYTIRTKTRILGKKIVEFQFGNCCKIVQSFALRQSVLASIKYVNTSAQKLLKFLRKLRNKSNSHLCLKQLLICMCHLNDLTSYIVDQTPFNTHDLLLTCKGILASINSSTTSECRNRLEQVTVSPAIKSKQFVSLKPDVLIENRTRINKNPSSINKMTVGEMREMLKEAHFKTKSPATESFVCTSTHKIPFWTRLSLTNTRICDAILSKLVDELVSDLNSGISNIVENMFDREFTSSTCSKYSDR